jgi:hypothetical protein
MIDLHGEGAGQWAFEKPEIPGKDLEFTSKETSLFNLNNC